MTAIMHVGIVEAGVFMLFFLMFVLLFFIFLIFWRYKFVLVLFFITQTCFLAFIPYGMIYVIHKIVPIQVTYTKFDPFVYTTGFSFDITIQNKSKIRLKECMLSIIPLRKNQDKFITRLKDIFLPLAAYTKAVQVEILPNQYYQWQGIIDGYNHPESEFKAILDCH